MDRFFGLDTPARQEDLALVHSFHDEVSVNMAKALLQDEEIPFLAKDRGAGGAMRVIAGFSMYAVDLFVRPEDAERASALMKALFDNAEGENNETDEEAPQ